jgi:adenylate cyclase
MKKILLSPLWALVTVALLAGTYFTNPQFIESVRLRYFDTLITSKAPTTNNIYTANIDEETLDKLGQWPLPRNEYAKIIKDLYDRGAGLVVLNVLMADIDRLGGDLALSKSLTEFPVILNSVPSDRNKNVARNPGASIINSNYANLIITYPGIIANIPELEQSATGVGIVNTLPEIDGVNRRIPLVVNSNGKLYPALSLEILRVIAGDPSFQIKLSSLGVDKLRIPKFGIIPTDELGRVWIDFSQQSKSVSLANLPPDLKGAVVIVGPTAVGIANPVPTATGAVFPQQLQAALLGTMFNKVNIQRPQWAAGVELLIFVIASIMLIFLTRWMYVGIAFFIITSGVMVFAGHYAYANFLQLWDFVTVTGGFLMVALHGYTVKFINEFLQKQQIKKQFGTYLSPDLVAQLQRNPELLKLGGESVELSIMFTDVRGFTTISEHYGADVQGLTKIMNRYMTAMTKRILENKGTLDKYIGDAQMAFWNAPLSDAEHAKNAVRTGLQMMGSLDEFNKEVTAEGVPAFGMGLGINTATVVVGNMGSTQRFDYTCLGDGVNLASRIEGQSKTYGVKIVLGQRTAELVKDEYFVLELDKIAVKGKIEGVHIFTVLSSTDKSYSANREHHDLMLQCYREQKWASARKFTHDLIGEFNGEMDHYYELWLERIVEMSVKELPKDWDGTYIATSK